jgi:hypothetical protein
MDRHLSPAREHSRQTLGELLEMLGLPETYATELERLSYERGKVWSWDSD